MSQTVTRFVITCLAKDGLRVLMGPAQGRYTWETAAEAQAHLDAVTGNNSADTIKQIYGADPRFEVRPCECWAGHFDPVRTIFEE